MIELPFRRFKVCFHFSFFATVAILMLCADSCYAVNGLYACLLHETGHLAVMMLFGQPVKKLIFYGAGIKIIQRKNELLVGFGKQLSILAAGCTVNFLIYAMTVFFHRYELFGLINLMVGLFNILPLNCLDGGKIIVLCFYRFFTYDKAMKLEAALRSINIATVPLTAVIFFIAGWGNFTLYVTLVYLLFMSIV